ILNASKARSMPRAIIKRFGHAENGDFGTECMRKLHAVLKAAICQFGPVGCNENILVHLFPPDVSLRQRHVAGTLRSHLPKMIERDLIIRCKDKNGKRLAGRGAKASRLTALIRPLLDPAPSEIKQIADATDAEQAETRDWHHLKFHNMRYETSFRDASAHRRLPCGEFS